MSNASFRAVAAVTAPSSNASADDDRLQRLEALRAELDRVDDSLHDLLMRRAEVVVQVGALGAKGRVPLRPGREASIIRRLLGRNRGALAPAALVRVWREVLAGSSAQQHPMTIVIGDGVIGDGATGDAGLERVVREHFGPLIRAETLTPAAAIGAVRRGEATLAVLPLPSETARWWTALADQGAPRVNVVARVPFWARKGTPEALVLSAAAPDPSGNDRTLIAGAGLAGFETVAVYPGGLVEVSGFVTQEDPRLQGVPASVLGAYAVPVGEFE